MIQNYYRQQRFGGPADKYRARSNEQITAPEVRVISSTGEQLGVMPTAKALAMSREQGLDLIEIAPKAAPPVVKLTSFDKYRYQQTKLQQAQRRKQKEIEVKGVRLSVRTGQHDMEFKARAADKFLRAGNKVKIDLMLRGREKVNVGYALEQVNKFLSLITTPHIVEVPPKKMGNMINSFLGPK